MRHAKADIRGTTEAKMELKSRPDSPGMDARWVKSG